MAKVPMDVTTAGLIPTGQYNMTVIKVEHQVKVGEKWNNDGTRTVSGDEWLNFPADKRRVHCTFSVEGKGNLFYDFYMTDAAAGFVQSFMKATGIPFDKNGFDTDDFINKQFKADVVQKQEAGYNDKNEITKFLKV